jgi:hypothetical protein
VDEVVMVVMVVMVVVIDAVWIDMANAKAGRGDYTIRIEHNVRHWSIA